MIKRKKSESKFLFLLTLDKRTHDEYIRQDNFLGQRKEVGKETPKNRWTIDVFL